MTENEKYFQFRLNCTNAQLNPAGSHGFFLLISMVIKNVGDVNHSNSVSIHHLMISIKSEPAESVMSSNSHEHL